MALVISLDRGAQVGAGVDEDIVAAAVRVAVQQQRRLINAVDNTVAGMSVGCSGQSSEGGEQIDFVDDVADELTFLNDAGPPGLGRYPDTAFQKIALAAAKDRLSKTATRRRVVGHGAVVRHANQQRVLGNAQFLELRHQLADKRIDVALKSVLQQAPRMRRPSFRLA